MKQEEKLGLNEITQEPLVPVQESEENPYEWDIAKARQKGFSAHQGMASYLDTHNYEYHELTVEGLTQVANEVFMRIEQPERREMVMYTGANGERMFREALQEAASEITQPGNAPESFQLLFKDNWFQPDDLITATGMAMMINQTA